MGRYRKLPFTVTTTGSAGSATGSANVSIPGGFGRFIGISLDYDATAPGTTDTVVASTDPAGAAQTLYSKTDSVTDLPFSQFKTQVKDSAGAGIAGQYEFTMIGGAITITLSQCNALAAAVQGFIVVDMG